MKKGLFTVFLFALVLQVNAFIKSDSIPQHLLNLPLPDFKILLVDGKTNFYTENLSPDKKTMIMYFSPECDHCK